MPRQCSVISCSSIKSKQAVHLFKVRDSDFYAWNEIIRKVNGNSNRKVVYVCAEHFSNDDLITHYNGPNDLEKTTGLTRLNVAKSPHYTLGVLYGKILRTLRKMPEDAAYRKYTEQIISNRAKIVQETVAVEDFEKKIDCGQAEELIVQAENELVLSRQMLAFKPWESLIVKPSADQWSWPPSK